MVLKREIIAVPTSMENVSGIPIQIESDELVKSVTYAYKSWSGIWPGWYCVSMTIHTSLLFLDFEVETCCCKKEPHPGI